MYDPFGWKTFASLNNSPKYNQNKNNNSSSTYHLLCFLYARYHITNFHWLRLKRNDACHSKPQTPTVMYFQLLPQQQMDNAIQGGKHREPFLYTSWERTGITRQHVLFSLSCSHVPIRSGLANHRPDS